MEDATHLSGSVSVIRSRWVSLVFVREKRRRDSVKSLKSSGGCRIQLVDRANEETAN